MTNPPQKITTHHEDQVYYSIAKAELEQLKDKANLPEKVNCFFLIGLFLPCLINLLPIDFSGEKPISFLTVLNLLVVVVTFVIGVLQAKGWYEKRSSYRDFIASLEDRPKVEMVISGDADDYVSNSSDS